MKKIYQLSLACLVCVFLTACVSEPLKAPCDNYATYCGTKTKINHW